MNAGNLPLNVPMSKPYLFLGKSDGTILPSLTLVCANCGHDNWMHHVFHQEGHRPYQIRRCVECKGKKGRWVNEEELNKILDERWEY